MRQHSNENLGFYGSWYKCCLNNYHIRWCGQISTMLQEKSATTYAQTNPSLNELEEMLRILPEALVATSRTGRGYNPENAVQENGTAMAKHYNAIMKAIPSNYPPLSDTGENTGIKTSAGPWLTINSKIQLIPIYSYIHDWKTDNQFWEV